MTYRRQKIIWKCIYNISCHLTLPRLSCKTLGNEWFQMLVIADAYDKVLSITDQSDYNLEKIIFMDVA